MIILAKRTAKLYDNDATYDCIDRLFVLLPMISRINPIDHKVTLNR